MLIAGILFGLIAILALEKWRLQKNRARIPIRIHVNGSRGKSSTTRLIASSLRGNGLRAVGKTTGTLPRVIYETGAEEPIVRNGPTNISEQIKLFRWLKTRQLDALVVECMALRPIYQYLCEHEIVRASVSVITNIRADHLDVMGPTENDVALALAATIPENGVLVTAERTYLETLRQCCERRNAALVAVTEDDVRAVTNEEMDGFLYYEHKENVALALKVAERLGLGRREALAGMWAATPDPGALKAARVALGSGLVTFVNGFAANDPTSSELVWNIALRSFARPVKRQRRCVLLNLRKDRAERTQQLLECVATWKGVDEVHIMGSAGRLVGQIMRKMGLTLPITHDFGLRTAEDIHAQLLRESASDENTVIVGIGNVAGQGLALMDAFAKSGRSVGCNEFVKDVPLSPLPRPIPHIPTLEDALVEV